MITVNQLVLNDGHEFRLTTDILDRLQIAPALDWLPENRAVIRFEQYPLRIVMRVGSLLQDLHMLFNKDKYKKVPVRFARSSIGVLLLEPDCMFRFSLRLGAFVSEHPVRMLPASVYDIQELRDRQRAEGECAIGGRDNG